MTYGKNSLAASVVVVASLLTWLSQAEPTGASPFALRQLWSWLPAPTRPASAMVPDTPRTILPDTSIYRSSRRPKIAPQDRIGSPLSPQRRESPLLLKLPNNIKQQITPDDSLKNFDVQEKVGSELDFRDPTRVSFEEYSRYQQQQAVRDYFRTRSAGLDGESVTGSRRLIPRIYLGPIADRIFGGSYVDIRPQGAVTLRAGARFNRNRNPTLTLRQQRVGDFEYDQNLNLNVTGQIGEKMRLTFNYDTKAAFDFENNMKLDYTGYETDIIRKVELGNVSLPLNNSLVQGGQNLFGIKTQLQFGRLGVTAVASTLRGTADEVRVQNGAQSRLFEIKASQYERDRHFFLSHFFRERYDAALRNLPTVQSGIEIRRLEVYVTNDNRTTDNLRNVVTLMDLAEPTRVYRSRFQTPSPRAVATNNANPEFATILNGGAQARNETTVDAFLTSPTGLGLEKTVDFERVRARKLDPREYTFNAQLGYLSLNTALLPEQVLGVSYEYIYNGEVYKVGELVDDYANVRQDEVIFLKMLKATNPGVGLVPARYLQEPTLEPTINPLNENLRSGNLPTWDLMMKNIYPLNASQLNRDNFQLQIVYKDDQTGVDLISLKEGERIANRPLVEVLNLDNVNPNNDRNPDGNFDFFPGITIDPELGKVIFPVVEPFGSYLQNQFTPTETALVEKYVYNELYTQVQSDAQQVQVKDKFFLRGRFQATATDEIALPGIRVAPGSVRVRSGSTLLEEGRDYQVFYDQAKVKILNPSYLNSANELRVEFEKDAVVQIQPRRLVGARFDYRLNQDINFGATVLHLRENQAPGINRVSIGDEPGNNTIYGLDVNLRRDSRVLTKYLDMLPLISTKEPSSVAFSGEFARLVPGQTKLGRGENGVSYIDDFETARTPYSLGGLNAVTAWRLASTPLPLLGANPNGLTSAYRRAKLAWYTIDQTYYTNGQSKPANIPSGDPSLSNHYTRGIERSEIFPNRDLGATGNSFEFSFDMAYFPGERGQYNYTPEVLPTDGRKFANQSPAANAARYGGVSREITFDTDFDNANVEYLEFWLMDPFIGGPNGQINDSENAPQNNTTGGELYLNLGNVSEDVLKDGQHQFENGLPDGASITPQDVQRNIWGNITRQQFITDAFSSAPGGRALQDIGLDGLNDSDERAFFSGVYSQFDDPSADRFRHHLDGYYNSEGRDVKILGRYKNFNGMEGNSNGDSQQSSTAFPDKEDLNRDNVISDLERYYEYQIRLRPGQIAVGQNYVIDKITKNDVTWYQFRIPVRQYSAVRGTQDGAPFGFKSIRFVRMYMTQWQQPAVLRLVQLQFVANQWRRFLTTIAEPGRPNISTNQDADNFDVSTVSLEENGPAVAGPDKIPYVLPPGIERDREYGSSTVNRQQNEQSLRLCVEGLRDGYAKAAYKNISINMLRYKQLRLFLHAESQDQGIQDNQVRGFIRIGTDYTQNYYEYSIPLKMTRPGSNAQRDIWPIENEVQISLQQFIDAKAERNANNIAFNVPYTKTVIGQNGVEAQITIVGNPDFSAVQGAMIGIFNPTDDNVPKSVCLWADEFRVFDFDRESGYAATARFNTKLADLANITATGSFTSVGFGGLQDKVNQRSLDNISRGDLNATIAAEKFFPEKLGLRVPVLLQAGTESRVPKYDPLDPDTELTQSLQKFESADERAEYRKEVIDQTSSRSISVLNVRKERTDTERKVRPYDIENLALSYAITERRHTDIVTDRDFTRTYTGALAYVYQTTPRNYTPLANVKAFDSPYLKIFQELNFTPTPSRFAFRADLDRRYNERFLQRTQEPGQIPTTAGIPGVFLKSFFFNRIYDLKWDLTKSLILDYTATNRGVIDEDPGRTLGSSPEAKRNRELLRRNLFERGGRTTNFNQTVALTYRLPLDKFPLTDWLTADTRYEANYTWQAASTALRAPVNPSDLNDPTTEELNLGNTIQNNGAFSANGRIDLVKLYNKVRFLNIINNAPPPGARVGTPNAPQPAGSAPTASADSTKGPELRFLKAVLRSLMTARSLNFTYTLSNGTLLPGYLPRTQFFGLNSDFDAPGVPFLLGRQYDLDELYDRAAGRGWYTQRSDLLNTPLSSLRTENLTLQTTLEPFRDFNVRLDARRQKVDNEDVFYRLLVDEQSLLPVRDANGNLTGELARRQRLGTGSFSTSTITLQTMFGDRSANGTISKAFNRFVENRQNVLNRLTAANPNENGTYGYNSQDVLLPSFLDAYRGKSSTSDQNQKFNPFLKIPIPNWRIDYNGLAELPFVKRYFRSVTIRHAYTSVYNVGGYNTASQYQTRLEGGDLSTEINDQGRFIPYYVIGQVSIAERLSPLIGVDFQTLEKVTGRVELRTERDIGLNTTNAQVTELYTQELVIGFGYVTNGLKLPFGSGANQKVLNNELTARLDLSIRDNTTIQRTILDVVDPGSGPDPSVGRAVSLTTNGTRQVQLRPTIDYVLNQRLNLQFFFTRNISEPRVNNAFKTSSTEGGLQLRYSLGQ